MLVGHPLPLFSSWDGSWVFWVLGLFAGSWNLVWAGGVGCALIAFLAACVRSTRLILFLFVSSRNAWKVLQHLLCHALCALPQFTQDTFSFYSPLLGGFRRILRIFPVFHRLFVCVPTLGICSIASFRGCGCRALLQRTLLR